jgi:tetratricopeptide (TPR) repeat protein
MVTRIICLATLVTIAAPARAQDQVGDARRAFNEGEAAYNLGHFEEALTKYEEAYRLSRLPQILFNLGQAHRRIYEEKGGLEHLRKARDLYRSFLREVPASPQLKVVNEVLRDVEAKYAAEIHKEREHLLASSSGAEALRLAQDFVEQDNFEDATFALNKFFKTPHNARADLVTAYVLAARVALANKDEAKAREAFRRALVLDPSVAPPPSLGTEIQFVFEASRKSLEGAKPLAIRHQARGDVAPGQTPVIRVEVVSDPLRMVHALVLNFRTGGQAYSQVESTEPGTLMLPKTVTSGLRVGTRVEYYIEAVDEGGSILQSLGTSEAPFAFTVREERPLYKTWWFWTIAGVVVVGTTTAIATTREGPFQDGPKVLVDHP